PVEHRHHPALGGRRADRHVHLRSGDQGSRLTRRSRALGPSTAAAPSGPSGRRRSAYGARPGGGWVRRGRGDGETEVPVHFRGDGRAWGMPIYVPLITADLARAARAVAQVSLLDLAENTGLDAVLRRGVERGLHSLPPP